MPHSLELPWRFCRHSLRCPRSAEGDRLGHFPKDLGFPKFPVLAGVSHTLQGCASSLWILPWANPRANSRQGAPGAPQTPLCNPRCFWAPSQAPAAPKHPLYPPTQTPGVPLTLLQGQPHRHPNLQQNWGVLWGEHGIRLFLGSSLPQNHCTKLELQGSCLSLPLWGAGAVQPPKKHKTHSPLLGLGLAASLPPGLRLQEQTPTSPQTQTPFLTHKLFFLGEFSKAGDGVTLLGLSAKLGIGWAPHWSCSELGVRGPPGTGREGVSEHLRRD